MDVATKAEIFTYPPLDRLKSLQVPIGGGAILVYNLQKLGKNSDCQRQSRILVKGRPKGSFCCE